MSDTQRRVPDDVVRTIRGIARERQSLPTDRELAERYGLSLPLVRAIARRQRYAGVPDDEPKARPAQTVVGADGVMRFYETLPSGETRERR